MIVIARIYRSSPAFAEDGSWGPQFTAFLEVMAHQIVAGEVRANFTNARGLCVGFWEVLPGPASPEPERGAAC